MNDIVDKLRLIPASTYIPLPEKPRWNLMVGAISREAADTIDRLRAENASLQESVSAKDLQIASLKEERANRWCPDKCPITGRGFFMWIEHPDKGLVPTYGGPFDSYTIAEPDADGTFFCERYDHDLGGWLTDETVGIGLRLIDDQREDHEYGTVEDLTQQLAAANENVRLMAKQSLKYQDSTHAANGRAERYRTAIQQTLDENGHLADGEVCTLILLKRALSDIPEDDKEKS